MKYNATMRAGIDFSDMKIKVKKDVVIVKIPHAIVQSNKLDPTTIEFKDEKKAILNWNNQDDVAEVIALAEADIEENEHVDYEQLLINADEQTVELIHKLLDDSVGGREVEVEFY